MSRRKERERDREREIKKKGVKKIKEREQIIIKRKQGLRLK